MFSKIIELSFRGKAKFIPEIFRPRCIRNVTEEIHKSSSKSHVLGLPAKNSPIPITIYRSAHPFTTIPIPIPMTIYRSAHPFTTITILKYFYIFHFSGGGLIFLYQFGLMGETTIYKSNFALGYNRNKINQNFAELCQNKSHLLDLENNKKAQSYLYTY